MQGPEKRSTSPRRSVACGAVPISFALLLPTDAAAIVADLLWCKRCRAWVDKGHKSPTDEDDS